MSNHGYIPSSLRWSFAFFFIFYQLSLAKVVSSILQKGHIIYWKIMGTHAKITYHESSSNIYIYTYIHIYTHTYTYIYIYTHTETIIATYTLPFFPKVVGKSPEGAASLKVHLEGMAKQPCYHEVIYDKPAGTVTYSSFHTRRCCSTWVRRKMNLEFAKVSRQ